MASSMEKGQIRMAIIGKEAQARINSLPEHKRPAAIAAEHVRQKIQARKTRERNILELLKYQRKRRDSAKFSGFPEIQRQAQVEIRYLRRKLAELRNL